MSPSMLPLSVIILTFNEESNIGACLESVIPWAQEVLVVDSGSTDRTLDIVGSYGARVFSRPFQNYSHQRNWAQENLPLSYEWVFHIDADERVSLELAQGVRKFFSDASNEQHVSGAHGSAQDNIFRKTHRAWRPLSHLSLQNLSETAWPL